MGNKKKYKNNKFTIKKIPCSFYKQGTCAKGENCEFDHNIQQGDSVELIVNM